MRGLRRAESVLLGCAVVFCLLRGAPGAETVPADHARQMARGLELFKGGVGPLLAERCVKCHGGEKTKGELDLTTREGLLKGGAAGAAIVVARSKESKLIRLL